MIETFRCILVREKLEGSDAIPQTQATGPADIARIARQVIGDSPQEHFIVLTLDARYSVRGVQIVTVGTADASLVHPREVFRAAILANAAAIVLVHNHPTGDPTPSPEDRAITRQLADAGKLIGIPLIDHIILGWDDSRYAFSEMGLI